MNNLKVKVVFPRDKKIKWKHPKNWKNATFETLTACTGELRSARYIYYYLLGSAPSNPSFWHQTWTWVTTPHEIEGKKKSWRAYVLRDPADTEGEKISTQTYIPTTSGKQKENFKKVKWQHFLYNFESFKSLQP